MQKSFLEFFAGTGLVRLGLEPEGWKCAWANDICDDKKDAYVANFGNDDFELNDIWNVVNEVDRLPKNVFLATASFPCTDLSVAGARKGLVGEQSGTLKAFLSIVEKQKLSNQEPVCILLENVQGFLTSHKGADVSYTVSELNRLGYIVDIIELDAKYFTPQSRPRVFVIAVLEKVAKYCMNTDFALEPFSKWNTLTQLNPVLRTRKIQEVVSVNPTLKWGMFDFPLPPDVNSNLDYIVENLPDDSRYWWDSVRVKKLYSQMYDRHKEYIECMKNSDSYKYCTVYRRVRQGISRAELRTDGIAGCLRTPKGGSSKQILVQVGKGEFKVRFLTPREYARLQGVDDKFVLSSKDTLAYFAMGDAVCVPAITWLTQNSLNVVYDAYSKYLSDIDGKLVKVA